MKKVVGFGACVYDTLITCDAYPIENTKYKSENVFVSGGGPVGNALVIMSKLGVNAEVIGAFANDYEGKYLIEDFKKHGVKTDNTVISDGARSYKSYIILAEKSKTRTCLLDKGTLSPTAEQKFFNAIDGADVLHLDGNYLETAIVLAKYAKERGVLVSLDAGGIYDGIEKLLPYIDILIPSAEFACGFTGKPDITSAIESLQEKYSPKVLVVTDGENGGYYVQNSKVMHYDGEKVKAVDTNGAGDTFHGAFLVAFCEGKSVKDCCTFASKVAAYKCTKHGVRTFDLNRQTIDKI